MKKTFGSIAALSALLFCACSSSSSSSPGATGDSGILPTGDAGTTCSATASGGTSETLPCSVGVALLSGSTNINISSPDQSDAVSILLQFQGAPTATTYTAATVVTSLADFKSADKTQEWQEQAANGVDTQGTFSLVISDIGTPTDIGGGTTAYDNMHGTFTGTFVQVTADGTSTEIDGGAPASMTAKF